MYELSVTSFSLFLILTCFLFLFLSLLLASHYSLSVIWSSLWACEHLFIHLFLYALTHPAFRSELTTPGLDGSKIRYVFSWEFKTLQKSSAPERCRSQTQASLTVCGNNQKLTAGCTSLNRSVSLTAIIIMHEYVCPSMFFDLMVGKHSQAFAMFSFTVWTCARNTCDRMWMKDIILSHWGATLMFSISMWREHSTVCGSDYSVWVVHSTVRL